MVGWTCSAARCPPSSCLTPLPQQDGEKIGKDKEKEVSHQLPPQEKQARIRCQETDKGKIIYSSLYILHRLTFTPDSFSLDSFTLSSPSSVRDGEWGLWSVHNSSSHAPASSAVSSSSLGALHGLQIFMDCSSLGFSPVLQLLQQMTATAWGPPWAAVWISTPLWAAEGQPTAQWFSLRTGVSCWDTWDTSSPHAALLSRLSWLFPYYFSSPFPAMQHFALSYTHYFWSTYTLAAKGSAKGCGGAMGFIWNGLWLAKGSLGC